MTRERIGARRPGHGDNRTSPRRRGALGLLATIAGLMTVTISAQSARAGEYVMRNCNVPGHRNAPMHPWQVMDDAVADISIVDGCATGNGIGFTLNGSRQIPAGRNANIIIQRPASPRGHIEFVKSTLWYAARLAGSGSPLNVTTYYAHSDWTTSVGWSNSPPGSENLVAEQQLSANTRNYYVGIYCGPLTGWAGPTAPCIGASGAPLLIRGMEVTLREDVPPIVLEPSGSLLEPGQQSGVRTLRYTASDPESGIRKVDVLLDGTVVASQNLNARCPYSDFTVCPASLDETLEVDTRTVANGSHRLAVRVQDAAGNERVVEAGRAVDVANAANQGSSSAYTLVATLNGSSRTTSTVPYGRRASVRGRLQGPAPVAAGIPIEVLETLDRKGKREVAAAQVETKADGSFSVRLKTHRPSRTLRLVYRPNGFGEIASRTLRLRVRAASRLRASLRGRVVRFSGRVLSAPIPGRGKRVLMEGRSPGSAWTQFRSFRTDRRGRFSGTYRLRVRRPGVALKIRAVVPSEDGYGYTHFRSRAVSLRVR